MCVERIGDDSAEADAELLAMTVECLLKAGLKEFLKKEQASGRNPGHQILRNFNQKRFFRTEKTLESTLSI